MNAAPSSRRFTLADQRAFAELSGDSNPIHVDPVEARRLLSGRTVIHGMHLVLFALDRLVAAGAAVTGVASLWVQFERAAGLDETIRVRWSHDGERMVGRLEDDEGVIARIHLTPRTEPVRSWAGRCDVPLDDCLERELADLEGVHGSIPLLLPPAWAKHFPHLAAAFSPDVVAVLLATSRLVGMTCPGRRSLYAALRLQFNAERQRSEALDYQVTRTDTRVNLVEIAIDALGISGTIGALLRPKPTTQPQLRALQGVVAAETFDKQRAIIVGGSRGLGELTAKLLAAGGADVTITYLRGRDDAERIISEARAAGGRIRAAEFDVVRPPLAEPSEPYTHLYYFATPPIAAGRPGHFSSARFSRLLAYYVEAAARSAEWFQPRSISQSCFWYPSTVFVAEPDPHFAEYAAAKSCGEALCARLAHDFAPMRFVVERLPRLPTDQTQAIAGSLLADGTTTLLAALHNCA